MRKNISFVILLSCSFLFLCASELHWQQGYELLQNNQYQDALSHFLTLKEETAALYMMIAVCYQKLGHDVFAKGYREKAFISATLRQKIRMLDQTILHAQETPISFYRKKIEHFLYALAVTVPLIVWQLFILLCIFFLLFWNHIFVRCFLLLVLLVVVFFAKQTFDLQKPRAIVIVPETYLFIMPTEKAPVVSKIDKGKMIFLFAQKNGYVKVKMEDGLAGWILAEDIFDIVSL